MADSNPAISVETVGANPVRFWGLDTGERVRRMAAKADLGGVGAPAVLANADHVFDPAWLAHVARHPGMAVTLGGIPVLAHARDEGEAAAVRAAMRGEKQLPPAFEAIAYEDGAEIENKALRKRERPFLLEGHESFDAFTRWKLDPERPYQYHLDTAITPLTDYLVDLHGNLLTDYLGRYERLHEDWDHICRQLGIAAPPLPHKRQATDRQKDYRSYYSSDLAELVGNYFRRDVELLGYRFDPD